MRTRSRRRHLDDRLCGGLLRIDGDDPHGGRADPGRLILVAGLGEHDRVRRAVAETGIGDPAERTTLDVLSSRGDIGGDDGAVTPLPGRRVARAALVDPLLNRAGVDCAGRAPF